MKRLALASAILATLVGCGGHARDGDANSGTGPSRSTSAATTDPLVQCRLALPGRDVVSATRTTVGDLRAWGYGGPVQKHPLGSVFPSAAPSEPAIWCWTRDATDSYTAWGAHARDAAGRAITVIGPTDQVPVGPPKIP